MCWGTKAAQRRASPPPTSRRSYSTRSRKLLSAPELIAPTWATAKQGNGEITEREVTVLLADFATVWNELFPAEQARIVRLLVERVNVHEDALEMRIRAQGLASLIGELRQSDERTARAA